MKKISCFVPYAGKEQVEKTIKGLQARRACPSFSTTSRAVQGST